MHYRRLRRHRNRPLQMPSNLYVVSVAEIMADLTYRTGGIA